MTTTENRTAEQTRTAMLALAAHRLLCVPHTYDPDAHNGKGGYDAHDDLAPALGGEGCKCGGGTALRVGHGDRDVVARLHADAAARLASRRSVR